LPGRRGRDNGAGVWDQAGSGARVAVIGGGVAGLASALAFARLGAQVTVFERDEMPLPPTPLEAFRSWRRRGAPQVWHSHAFLGRLGKLLRERLPDLHAELLRHGAEEIALADLDLSGLVDFEPEPGDRELVLLACRRITFEWVLRRLVEREPGVRFRSGVRVVGLSGTRAPGSPPEVRGVRLRSRSGGEELTADFVVDASGRRSALSRWLGELGAEAPAVRRSPCGIFYTSRFYRLRAGRPTPPARGPIGVDLGYLKYGLFPGDSGVFSLTFAADPADAPLRALYREGPFAAAAAAIPDLAPWVDAARSEAITPVRVMAGLANARRRFLREGEPVALRVFAVGDAAIHTNPLYGRGCTLAFVHAFLLADAFGTHREDPAELARAFDEATRREVLPWYRAAVASDEDAREVADLIRRGVDPAAGPPPDGAVDPRQFVRSVLRDGLGPALRRDGVVLRAFLRTFHLLGPPEALFTDPEVVRRVTAVWQQRRSDPGPGPDPERGPSRSELVARLREAA